MKLHQLIVSGKEVSGVYSKIVQETSKKFKEGQIFTGYSKVYTPLNSEGQPLDPETKELVTTVPKRLEYTDEAATALFDYEASRDSTNCVAKADLVVDGVLLAKDLPATYLLSLENKLREVRNAYDEAPTLDLSKKWEKTESSPDIFATKAKQYRTKKETKGVVLSPSTDKHAAQVKEVTEDVTVGHFDIVTVSGAIHPGTKSELLRKIDRLIVAVKQARMKANEAEVIDVKVGVSIFKYIHSVNS